MSTQFILNNGPCQFSQSKTQSAIKYIETVFLGNGQMNSFRKNGNHHITIIYTNKSLAETIQWKYRLNDKLKNLNIRILSSKSDSVYNNIDNVISSMVSIDKPDDLFDVLVMCSHSKRIRDGIHLIDVVKQERINLENIGIHDITFSVFFDEADKLETLNHICDFLRNKHFFSYNDEDENDGPVVKDVHFITATAFKIFWKKLAKSDIVALKSIECYLEDDTIYEFDKHYDNYRKLKEHNIRFFEEHAEDVIEYIRNVLQVIDFSKPRVIYAPAKTTRVSHLEVAELFKEHECDTLIINGMDKKFIFANGEEISINDFNIFYKIKGELRDTLRMYRKLYPNNHLGITGSICIERGITFCTNGFNFTDAIISNYHAKNEASLVQFLGRSNGHKEYVDVHDIYIPEKVFRVAEKAVEMIVNVKRTKPEILTEQDFREQTSKERNLKAYHVPIIIDISEEEYNQIEATRSGTNYNEAFILSLCQKYANLSFEGYTKSQISKPKTEVSYKKNILSLRQSALSKNPTATAIKAHHKHMDVYQIWIDKKNKNFIVLFYDGTKITS